MKERISHSGVLALGILIGFVFFFVSYWWFSTITLGIAIGLFIEGGFIVTILFERKLIKKEGERC